MSKTSIVLDVVYEPGMTVDFAKLAEQKYGYSHFRPEAAQVVDDEDDEDDEDEDDKDEDDEGDDAVEKVKDSDAQAKEGDAPGDAPAKPAKKKRGIARYDLLDPFIDDDELQWEDQSTSLKDGFFVYSGNLVEEEEPAKSKERAKPAKRTRKPKAADGDAPPAKKPRAKKAATPAAEGAAEGAGEKKPRAKPGPKPGTKKAEPKKEPKAKAEAEGEAPKKPRAPRKKAEPSAPSASSAPAPVSAPAPAPAPPA